MMYCEFVEGTGCKDTPKNYEVFKNLEVMYVNTDMTKAEIYEYGKKLVDNSKTEQEIETERMIEEQLMQMENEIKKAEDRVARQVEYIDVCSGSYGFDARWERQLLRSYKNEVNELKLRFKAAKKFLLA